MAGWPTGYVGSLARLVQPPDPLCVLHLVSYHGFTTACLPAACRFGESAFDEMCFSFVVVYPRPPNITNCISMNAVGDPTSAICVGSAAAELRNKAVASVVMNATAMKVMKAIASAAAAGGRSGDSANATNATMPLQLISLMTVPSMQPYVAAGQLVPRGPPAEDLIVSEPYGAACPDMSYGMPLPKPSVLPPQVPQVLQQFVATGPESP